MSGCCHLLRGEALCGGAPFDVRFSPSQFDDLARDLGILVQGSGVAVLLKLGLLALGARQPASRLSWYLAATFVASIGSHMPGAWRHFSFLSWKVMKAHD